MLGPLTHEIDVGGRRRKVAHVKFLKEYVERKFVQRVTTVLEDDKGEDRVHETNEKVEQVGEVIAENKDEDIQ